MELENKPITLEDRESKEVSLTKIHVEKYYDRDENDALIHQVNYDNPPSKKLSDPSKLILKPLPCGLEYTSLETLRLSYHIRI